jgi:hypothetical protein
MEIKRPIKKSPEGAPILNFGKFKGLSIDKVPMSYLRFMLGHNFDKEYMDFARKKLETNKTSSQEIEITRHAIDKYSMLYLDRWDKKIGLASFITEQVLIARAVGNDVSKNRFEGDSIIKEMDGIKYVFNSDGELPYLITVI